MRALAPLALFSAAVSLSGCGIISKDFEGDVRFDFEIDTPDSRIMKTLQFDPESNEDVRNNRDAVESGRVRAIWLRLDDVGPENRAYQVAGQVDVKGVNQSEDAWIQAVGQWSGVPLYDDGNPPNPAIGQEFKLDLPVGTQEELSKLIFIEKSAVDFRLNGFGYDQYLNEQGPVQLKGEVRVELSITVSVP